MSPGIWQILIVVVIVLLLFGPKRIPSLGKSLGEAIRGFKKGISDDEIDVTDTSKAGHEKISAEEQAKATAAQKEKESHKS